MNEITSALMNDIEAFLEKTGMSPTAFGVGAVGDGHLIRDIRAGVDIRSSTIVRVKAYMVDNKQRRSPRKGNGHAVAA